MCLQKELGSCSNYYSGSDPANQILIFCCWGKQAVKCLGTQTHWNKKNGYQSNTTLKIHVERLDDEYPFIPQIISNPCWFIN